MPIPYNAIIWILLQGVKSHSQAKKLQKRKTYRNIVIEQKQPVLQLLWVATLSRVKMATIPMLKGTFYEDHGSSYRTAAQNC